ncbi:hypothetical protein WJX73_008711 [Symbiochloris irregularis]|uniref:Uncharacterized protein n=1 Tax=Symbiochloris irregularis TaxID=706552 RepID=A0AAW1PIT0_9CHLO
MASSTGEFWETGLIDVERLQSRAITYAKRAGASAQSVAAMDQLLQTPLARHLLELSAEELEADLVNDAYKPKMHKLYCQLYTGVSAEFMLNIRKGPISLLQMREQDPVLFDDLKAAIGRLQHVQPMPAQTVQVLQDYYSMEVPRGMSERVNADGVAPITLHKLTGGKVTAVASGSVTAASNAETSVTQLIQDHVIRAQVRALHRRTGMKLDRTERLANALGHLVLVVDSLSQLPEGIKTLLFAGRRSTDRAFLLLQNVFCAQHLHNYSGTSSIYAVCKIDAALRSLGSSSSDSQRAKIGPLAGTHAHEVMSITAQLLARYDYLDDHSTALHDHQYAEQGAADSANDKGSPESVAQGSPVGMSALLAHLLFLRVNGGLASATALTDTFGTEAFLSLAAHTRVPTAFIEDMQTSFSDEAHIQPGSMVLDLFKMWRLDSGDFAAMAEAVMCAWDARRQAAPDLAAPRPLLINSNLSSVQEALECARLPERIRPAVLAFGGLADQFLPFPLSGSHAGEEATLELASVVMKAVQARHPGLAADGCMPCAAKLGDDADASKAQVDARHAIASARCCRDAESGVYPGHDEK